jgi:hypothetical protein
MRFQYCWLCLEKGEGLFIVVEEECTYLMVVREAGK